MVRSSRKTRPIPTLQKNTCSSSAGIIFSLINKGRFLMEKKEKGAWLGWFNRFAVRVFGEEAEFRGGISIKPISTLDQRIPAVTRFQLLKSRLNDSRLTNPQRVQLFERLILTALANRNFTNWRRISVQVLRER